MRHQGIAYAIAVGVLFFWLLVLQNAAIYAVNEIVALKKQVAAQQEQLDRLWVIDRGKPDREQGGSR